MSIHRKSHFLRVVFVVLGGVLWLAGNAAAEQLIMNTRPVPLTENPDPPPLRPEINTDVRQMRNYPDQPPIIPHKTEGYSVTRNFNKCLSCHARRATRESQAPMISITHYMDRDGQSLASISPRRYFCNQCHVSQVDVRPPVENTFIDMDDIIARPKAN